MSGVELIEAQSESHLREVRVLFVEYNEAVDEDLCFQNFDGEPASLPGDYVPPDGRLFLAVVDGKTAGCIALRRIEPGICEMKRLFVRPGFRGLAIGKRLASAIIDAAREIGYTHMRLDTLPSMTAAIRLYESLGFKEIGPYRNNPIEGARFMELDITARCSADG